MLSGDANLLPLSVDYLEVTYGVTPLPAFSLPKPSSRW